MERLSDDLDIELILKNIDLDEDIPVIYESLFEEEQQDEVKISKDDISENVEDSILQNIPSIVFVNEDDILVHVDPKILPKQVRSSTATTTTKATAKTFECNRCRKHFKREKLCVTHQTLCLKKGKLKPSIAFTENRFTSIGVVPNIGQFISLLISRQS